MLNYIRMFQQNTYLRLKAAKSCLIVLLLSSTFPSLAASNVGSKSANDDSAIEIESDQANYNQQEGVAHYVGNVIAKQEHKTLNSNELFMHKGLNGFNKFIANGTPLKRAVLNDKDPVKGTLGIGKANKIIYYLDENKAVLIGNAELLQDGYKIRGEHLTYSFTERRLISLPQDNQRTTVILPAEEVKG